jgi:hypothetical protein
MPGPSDLDAWMRLTLGALATWRVAHLVVYEDGPADLVARLRERLGQSAAGHLMDCFHCVSVWVAAPLALAVAAGAVDRVVAWLGLSGVACLLERITKGERDNHGMLRSEAGHAETRDPDGARPHHTPAGIGGDDRPGTGAAGAPVLHGPRLHDGAGPNHRPRV